MRVIRVLMRVGAAAAPPLTCGDAGDSGDAGKSPTIARTRTHTRTHACKGRYEKYPNQSNQSHQCRSEALCHPHHSAKVPASPESGWPKHVRLTVALLWAEDILDLVRRLVLRRRAPRGR